MNSGKNSIIKIVLVICLAFLFVSACGKDNEAEESSEAVTEETTKAKKDYTSADYEAAGVNELNSVPILMYHRIYDKKSSETGYTGGNVDAEGYNRTAEAFEADLDFYYEQGYRMIRLTDYIDGNIDVEFGKSPIILTFDDGDRNAVVTGFEDDGTPIFDPTCAVGILEKYKEKYPDFNVTATFFLNGGLFMNKEDDAKVLKWMVDNGYDIGNHTWSHPHLPECSAAEIEEEVGSLYKKLDELIPGQYVNIVALPFGQPASTKDDPKFEKIFSGSHDGKEYTTKAALLCAWTRAFSPFVTEFDHTCIRRIRGYDNNGTEFDIKQNFDQLADGKRYISDGDPDTIVIRKDEEEGWLDNTFGKEVIRY